MRLITFGDSWVKGVGTKYKEGMSREKYESIAWNEDTRCFRNLLAKRLRLDNLNLSRGGSSNQMQFRLALKTFFGEDKINPETSDIVLWGITSVYRTELWHNQLSSFKSFFLPDDTAVSKILATQYHNDKEEIKILGHQMTMWNAYFKSIKVKNYWFNIFNDHSWSVDIDNFLFPNSSLLSEMINDHKDNYSYNRSIWELTDRKIKVAKELKLVNPFSGHPTIDGHKMIEDLLINEIKKELDKETK